MDKWKDGLIDLLFPPACYFCGEANGVIDRGFCQECFEDVRYLSTPLCPVCGIEYGAFAASDHSCENCLRQTPPFTLARSIAFYEGHVRQLLHNLKYRFDTTTVQPLLKIAQGFDFSAFESCEIILPVPLHVTRLRQRGMNQALLLARMLFPQRRADIFFNVLRRQSPTASQTLLNIEERKKNIKDSFSVQNNEIINKKIICLVDDVYTTGATAAECSRELLAGGAAEVRVLTVARVGSWK